jgi:hypothetical protein
VFKALLLVLLLIWFPVFGLQLVHLHMDDNSQEIGRLTSWEEQWQRPGYARNIPQTEIDSWIAKLQSEQLELQTLAQGLDFGLNLVLVFILMLAFILYKRGWPAFFSTYDGLTLFLVGFLFYTCSLLLNDFFNRYFESMNDLKGYLFFGGFAVVWISSLVGFILNRREIRTGLHKATWVNWLTGAAGLAGAFVFMILFFLSLTTPTLPTSFG